jgi:hypothetical protein
MKIEDTIDAFVDGITVDPQALDAALASPDGRAYLIDALALRQLMSDAPAEPIASPRGKSTLLFYARAAVVALGLLGIGYAAGTAGTGPAGDAIVETNSAQSITAPEPTRVIELTPGVNWHESKGGD